MLKYDNNDYKKRLTITLTWFAISLLVILIVMNIDPISGFISGVMDIIAPIVIGGAIAYLLNPVLKFFEFVVFKKLKNKALIRALSLILTYVYAIAFIALVVSVITPQLIESLLDIGKNYNTYIDTAVNILNETLSKISSNFENFDSEHIREHILDLFLESENVVQTVMQYVISYGTTLITILKNVIIGLFISIYILISKERLYAQATKGARAYMSNKMYNNCMRYLRITNATFGRFFIGKLFDATIVFLLTFVTLLILRIKYPMLLAMTVGVLTIIPFFGIILGTLLTSVVVIFVAPEKTLLFIIIMIIIQQIDTNVIAPKILGNSAGISSLGVIIAVTITGAYFGIVGMILGVPLFAIIISIVKKWLEKRLSSKQLSVNTKEYYDDPSYSTENEEHRSVIRIIFDPLLKFISKKVNKAISNHLEKSRETEESETAETQRNSDENPPQNNADTHSSSKQ